jgi:serralysin
MIHEWGHIVGLGHAGGYDVSQDNGATPQQGPYDSRAWSIMSYIEGGDPEYPQSALPTAGVDWGITGNALTGFYDGEPTTWMPLDSGVENVVHLDGISAASVDLNDFTFVG